MLRLKQLIGACILASAFLPAVVTHAATYYVATTGNNSNPGTSTQPWRTVAYAASRMVAGDTTYVRAGTYREGFIQLGNSGTQSAPIKLLNAPGESPIINFHDNTATHQLRLQNRISSQRGIGWITIEGFEIRNGYVGLKIINGHNITIRRNWIHHNISQGVLGNGTRILIDRNKINQHGDFVGCANGQLCNQSHGIYMHGTAVTVTNNLFYANIGVGVQLNGTVSYSSSKHPSPDFALSRNWVISNNTIAYQGHGAGIAIWGSTCDDARIENNILYENCVNCGGSYTNGIAFTNATSSTGIVIRNNLAYASGSGGTRFLGPGGSYTQSSNIVNTLNPRFVNAPATLPSSPNFALASGSPAVDRGLYLSLIRTSYTGAARPRGTTHDIGAYEYYGSSHLAAPTSLQATY